MENVNYIPTDYAEMMHIIGEEKFYERFQEIKKTADEFIEEAGYKENVECNERILMHALLDYWVDIFRLKEFHEIERVRTDKIFAYLIAWILKRKPLQFIRYTEDEKDIFVNERFALFLMLNEQLLCGQKQFVAGENQDRLDDYIDLVLYYFKYRECNPQVIELMIESFKMGTLVMPEV
ncbi:hypothetical protein [Claveliimonas bilis]|uniref:hypothetical protein n=1 Tax=Claveliimonas bilis TaxID=3028070 RepID=UPI00292D4872|nr:hypothetical protein [Claveliimonas bilis]